MSTSGPPYVPRFKPGDVVKIVCDNDEVENITYGTRHNATGMEVTLPDRTSAFDSGDNTWSLSAELNHISGGTEWVNEACMELALKVTEDELAEAIASITGRPLNPNIQSGTTHREISISSPWGVRPDDCAPLTVITIGHPANEIYCIKVPDAKHATKNRWRNVATGKLVDPEDFRAGWNFHPMKEQA